MVHLPLHVLFFLLFTSFDFLLSVGCLMEQLPQSSSIHVYSPSLRLKLYQAFIFSVPILFTIILLLLFYLFYLKRRGSSNLSSSSHMQPRSLEESTAVLSLNDPSEKLAVIIFNEDSRAIDTQCCVCLGDFETKEKLHQIPSCKHMFHSDCIHPWLMSNTTCPLCRASILPTKMEPPIRLNILLQSNVESGDHRQHDQNQVLVGIVDTRS